MLGCIISKSKTGYHISHYRAHMSDEVLMVPLDWVLGMLYWIICFSSPRKARQGMVLYELIF